MNIIGLKLTHDAAISYIKDGELKFMCELEKLPGGKRYTDAKGFGDFRSAASACGYDLDDLVNSSDIVIDGWRFGKIEAPFNLLVADYVGEEVVEGFCSLGEYISYSHAKGHILGSYMTSEFGRKGQPAYTLLWDGGQKPHLYHVNSWGQIKFIHQISGFHGTVFSIMGYYFGPYKDNRFANLELEPGFEDKYYGQYDWPGKLMSFAGLGMPRKALTNAMEVFITQNENYRIEAINLTFTRSRRVEHGFFRYLKEVNEKFNFPDEDVVASVQLFLSAVLTGNLLFYTKAECNLVFTGGSALNIKWNSMIRKTGHFDKIWVPPFPNDCGSSLGAACVHMNKKHRGVPLKWSVYSGPRMVEDGLPDGWASYAASEEDVAATLARGASVVVLSGSAELGPRALGHRSILSSPASLEAKKDLNRWKQREDFRPVAPLVPEEYAPLFFKPGTRDKFMLFEHDTTEICKNMAPAIVHLDGSSRVQTISKEDCPSTYKIAKDFFSMTMRPLCNTSANTNGGGFFASIKEAASWCDKVRGINFIFCNGVMYESERERLCQN